MIPRIIHQTWKNNQVPKHWESSPEAWKEHHPEWEYWFWTDKDLRELIRTRYPWFLRTYDSYPYNIQRVDAARPFILKTYGGLYSDLDIQPNKPLDDLLERGSGVFLVSSPNAKVLTNSLMASVPEDPFWDHVITLMEKRAKKPSKKWVGKHLKVFNTTGPFLLTEAYRTYTRPVTLLPPAVNQCDLCCPKPCTRPDAYVTLLKGGSWESWDTKVFNFVLCRGKLLLLLVVVFILVFLVWLFRRRRGRKSG